MSIGLYMAGDIIGRLLIMEFANNESAVFDVIMNMLGRYPDFHKYTQKTSPCYHF